MPNLADRILVIDHQKEDRLRLSDYLIAKGYLVQSVSTIQQATLLIDDEAPDLIFADISNEEIQEIPFLERDTFPASLVIVSDVKSAGDVVACLRAGAADFILKPVSSYSSVDHVIHRILDKIRLAKLNRRLHKELEEGNKKLSLGIQELRADQKAGLQVQLKMLPEVKKEIHGFSFDHRIKPSLYLSGDFLDYFNLDQHRSMFYFADVSGHGASSAFVTVLLKNLTMRLKRNLKRNSSDELSCPDQFLRRVNQELLTTDLGKHVTIFVGIIDKQKRELIYSIGGHFPLPILTSAGMSEYLEGKGMAVGLFPAPTFKVYKKDLPDGFKITVFSDGILEVSSGPALKEKEKLFLEVVSQEQRGIESLFSSLGLDGIDDLPDDIAVLTISDTQKSARSESIDV
jgi:sigma-B regulation protein RsbU (phosphoserine phosphatase)